MDLDFGKNFFLPSRKSSRFEHMHDLWLRSTRTRVLSRNTLTTRSVEVMGTHGGPVQSSLGPCNGVFSRDVIVGQVTEKPSCTLELSFVEILNAGSLVMDQWIVWEIVYGVFLGAWWIQFIGFQIFLYVTFKLVFNTSPQWTYWRKIYNYCIIISFVIIMVQLCNW